MKLYRYVIRNFLTDIPESMSAQEIADVLFRDMRDNYSGDYHNLKFVRLLTNGDGFDLVFDAPERGLEKDEHLAYLKIEVFTRKFILLDALDPDDGDYKEQFDDLVADMKDDLPSTIGAVNFVEAYKPIGHDTAHVIYTAAYDLTRPYVLGLTDEQKKFIHDRLNYFIADTFEDIFECEESEREDSIETHKSMMSLPTAMMLDRYSQRELSDLLDRISYLLKPEEDNSNTDMILELVAVIEKTLAE